MFDPNAVDPADDPNRPPYFGNTEDQSEALRAKFGALSNPSWSERVALSFIETLSTQDVEEAKNTVLLDVIADGEHSIRVVYLPYFRDDLVIGLHRTWDTPVQVMYIIGDAHHQTPEDFGANMVICDVIEPLGLGQLNLEYSEDGIGWWGDGYLVNY